MNALFHTTTRPGSIPASNAPELAKRAIILARRVRTNWLVIGESQIVPYRLYAGKGGIILPARQLNVEADVLDH
jgi:hypothetical protein